MFREVVTPKDHQMFSAKWGKIAEKYSYSNKPAFGVERRFVIELNQKTLNENDAVIGALEFVPFNPEVYSIVESYHPFSQIPDVAENREKTFEIGKLCIDEEYQATGYFKDVLACIFQHHLDTGATQYVAMMRYYLFQMLTEKFKFDIKGLAEPKANPIDLSLPIMFKVEDLIKNPLIKRIIERQFEAIEQ